MNKQYVTTQVIEPLKKIIKKKISSSTKLLFFAKVFNHWGDTNFINERNIVHNNANVFEWHSYGEKNPDKNILLIEMDNMGVGMGVLYQIVLLGMNLAKEFGFVPVVEFEQNRTRCQEEPGFMGTDNPYEYFFKQPGGISLMDAKASKHVFIAHQWHIDALCRELGYTKLYYFGEKYLKTLGGEVKNLELTDYVSQNMKSDKGKILPEDMSKVLAVQIRGTDFNYGWKDHPIAVLPDEFFSEIDSAIENYGFTNIFLATDDSGYLEAFKQRYQDKLLFYEAYRDTGDTNIAMKKARRTHNNFLNAYEVLRDIYTLASCGGFVAGLSNVPASARIVRYGMKKPFLYEKILDKGRY